MKKVILSCLAAATMFAVANAQTTNTDRLKPVAGTWGVGFSINGVANLAGANWMTTGLSGINIYDPMDILDNNPGNEVNVGILIPQEMFFGRYYLTDKTALRFGLGLNSRADKRTNKDSIGGQQLTTVNKFSGFSWALTGGIEHHCYDNSRRIDPYFGGQLNIGAAGPFKQTITQDLTGANGYSNETVNKLRGGMNFSLDFIVGAQVFIAKNWALGIESNLGWGLMTAGGKFNQDVNNRPTGGTATTSSTEMYQKDVTSGFRVGNATAIRCSFFW